MKSIKLSLFAVLFTILMGSLVSPHSYASDPVMDRLGEMPVQHSGRVKPFESFAREAVLYMTGRFHFRAMKPTQLVWEWISQPEKWDAEPFIPASFPALVKEFGVKQIHGRVSPEVVLSDHGFMQKTEAALARRADKEKLSLLDQKRIEVYEKAAFFRSIGEGVFPGWVANPNDSRGTWFSLQALTSPEGQTQVLRLYNPEKLSAMMNAMKSVLLGFREKGKPELSDVTAWEASLSDLMASSGVLLPLNVLRAEITYLRTHPFVQAWPCYLASMLLGILALMIAGRSIARVFSFASLGLYLTGFGLHSYGFYLRCLIAGRPPVSNMYESIVWVSWAAVFFALVLSLIRKAPLIRIFAGAVASLALILAQKFPALLDPSITPLVPVLRSNLWLTVHVLTITLSYGAFLLGWGLAHGALLRFTLKPKEELANVKLSQYVYQTVQIGVILLAAGTVLGGVWANYSWGRFWGWDPKETWALIALLGYILVLHGRFVGWLKPFEFAAGAALAFLGVVMAWYGVNFVLAAGLHSYGFGGGGAQYVGAVAAADAVLVVFLVMLRHKRNARLKR